MNQLSDLTAKFFEDFERGITEPDPELVAACYADSFMFASPQGAQAIQKDGFLKVLPRRTAFFKALGLASSKIRTLEETRLDGAYIMVKAGWEMRFENDPAHSLLAEIAATYILHQQGNSLRIVFQLDHQDLSKIAEELGLLPLKE